MSQVLPIDKKQLRACLLCSLIKVNREKKLAKIKIFTKELLAFWLECISIPSKRL